MTAKIEAFGNTGYVSELERPAAPEELGQYFMQLATGGEGYEAI